MKKVKQLLALVLTVVLAVSMTACTKKAEETSGKSEKVEKVKIGYLPITHALPLYVETEVKGANVEMVKFGSWPELMDALGSGSIQGASVLIQLAMKAKSQGVDIKAVALGHQDGNVIISSKEINTPKDLKGKTFAIPSKLSTHNLLLNQMLEDEGMSVNDLKIIELPPAEMPVALSEGRIQGYCVAEPFGAKAVASDKGKVLKQSNEVIKGSVCCTLVMRDDFIKNNNKEAKNIVSKYVEAAKHIDGDKAEATKLAGKFLSADEKVLDLSLGWITFDKLKIEKEDYKTLADYVDKLKLIEKVPTYEEFVDASLIE